jgi:hypothetical protein
VTQPSEKVLSWTALREKAEILKAETEIDEIPDEEKNISPV